MSTKKKATVSRTPDPVAEREQYILQIQRGRTTLTLVQNELTRQSNVIAALQKTVAESKLFMKL